jgi:hypothetical protein
MDPDPGGPKTCGACGSASGSGFPTLERKVKFYTTGCQDITKNQEQHKSDKRKTRKQAFSPIYTTSLFRRFVRRSCVFCSGISQFLNLSPIFDT